MTTTLLLTNPYTRRLLFVSSIRSSSTTPQWTLSQSVCPRLFGSSSSSSSQQSQRKKRGGGRFYAKQQQQQKLQDQFYGGKRNKRPPKNWESKLPKQQPKQQQQQQQQEVSTIHAIPPTMLAPTASPYVFVARPALDDTTIDSTTLFSEAQQQLPKLFRHQSEFEYVKPQELKHEYPIHGVPEVAFLGRSNVGKSSLVNALMRKDLCKTSKSPGRTQQPYYYGLFSTTAAAANNKERTPSSAMGYMIDLPGYGFGTPRREVVEEWQAMTQEWLLDRRDVGVLKRVFLLLDARREGPSELDLTILKWLEDADISYTVVLTKADRMTVPLVVKQVNDLCLRYFASQQAGDVVQSPIIHATSSKQNWGIQELMLSVETEFVGDKDSED